METLPYLKLRRKRSLGFLVSPSRDMSVMQPLATSKAALRGAPRDCTGTPLNGILVKEGPAQQATKRNPNGPPRVIPGAGIGISRDGSGVAVGPSLTSIF